LVLTGLGLRCNVKRNGSTITEFFPPACRKLPAGPWTQLSNSFGTLGVRILHDTAIGMGNPTTVPFGANDPIPAGGFTAVQGKFYADTLDPLQTIAVPNGHYTVVETRLEFGAPAVAGDQFQCKYLRQGGADFDSYGTSVQTITLTAPPAQSSISGVGMRGAGAR
jgi:hypothetical protein